MNAHALLTSQGWLGTGHALDSRIEPYYGPTYTQKGKRGLAYDPATAAPNSHPDGQATTGNGLVRPLLVSQRHGSRYGIGKKAHEPQSGNEWWLKGFQSALDNIGKSGSERTSGTSTPDSANGYTHTGKHAGLYRHFVKGQLMSGTIGIEDKRKPKKRKSDILEEDENDTLAVAPVRRLQTARELEASIPYFEERDKSRRPAHRRAQSTDVEQFAAMAEFLGAAEGVTEKVKKKNKRADNIDTPGIIGVGITDWNGEKQIRSEHRTNRKKQKEDKGAIELLLAQMVEEEMTKLSSMDDESDDQDSEPEDIRSSHRSRRER